jgi:hypothetical protein
MAGRRHLQTPHAPPGGVSGVALIAILWICGLLAGFYAMLSVGTRYGCGVNAHGLACRSTGTILGVGIVVAVIATVTAASLLAWDATTWRARLLRMSAGLALLIGCLFAARALIGTA